MRIHNALGTDNLLVLSNSFLCLREFVWAFWGKSSFLNKSPIRGVFKSQSVFTLHSTVTLKKSTVCNAVKSLRSSKLMCESRSCKCRTLQAGDSRWHSLGCGSTIEKIQTWSAEVRLLQSQRLIPESAHLQSLIIAALALSIAATQETEHKTAQNGRIAFHNCNMTKSWTESWTA